MNPQDPNLDPATIHAADQFYAHASQVLDHWLDSIRQAEPTIYGYVGNTDSSVLFDYLKQFIQQSRQRNGMNSVAMTEVICAAALTRLVRAPRTNNDPLVQLERELHNDDDN